MISPRLMLLFGVVCGLTTSSPTAAVPAAARTGLEFRHDVLRPGTAREAGLLPERVAELPRIAASYLAPTADHPGHPAYAGATVLAAHHGVVVSRFAVGDAVRYTAGGAGTVELPPERRIPARTDTVWDLASLSKLFTTIVVLQQAEAGRIDLDAPVANYLGGFAAGGKEQVTARQLLTHRSGLPAFLPLYAEYPTPGERLAAALAAPVTAGTTPGRQFVYSDIGLIALGELITRVTGEPLADAVRDGVTGPLGMRDTGYNPAPGLRDRIAATEYEPSVNRGVVWGEVHDENAWALGGAAGHAGLFSTADDLAILCQTLLNGGAYRGKRILSEAMLRQALVDYGDGRGLGFELGNHTYMDGMSSPVTFGHTGFTGTSVVIDPLDQSFLILLSNRVHPDRAWGTNVVARRALARAFAAAHPVRGLPGGRPWRAEPRDGAVMTLTAPLRRAAGEHARASFHIWYDTQPGHDTVRVESSADGVTWQAARTLTGFGGRRWWHLSVDVPAGATRLRFAYRTDEAARGRGVLLDHLRVVEPGAILVDGMTTLAADGWNPAPNA